MAKGNEELEQASELEKARGETESQQELRSYHEGDFQTTDPVTGEPRGKTMNWEDEDHPRSAPLGEERTPADLEAAQEEERKRSAAGAEPTSARKTAAKKATRKRSR